MEGPTYVELLGGELLTVAEFKEACETEFLMDYDGFGEMVKDGRVLTDRPRVIPSERDRIPEDVTHILWFNK